MKIFFYKLTYVNYDNGEEESIGGAVYAENYVGAMQQLQEYFGNDLIRIDYLEDSIEGEILTLPTELADSVREAHFSTL